jgi:hypothetical protein
MSEEGVIVNWPHLAEPRISFPLAQAQVCLDCDHVFAFTGEDRHCPHCSSRSHWPLANWMNRDGRDSDES